MKAPTSSVWNHPGDDPFTRLKIPSTRLKNRNKIQGASTRQKIPNTREMIPSPG